MGLLLPEPVIGAACHGPELSELRGIVRERPLLFVTGDGDRYSAATRSAHDLLLAKSAQSVLHRPCQGPNRFTIR